MAKAKKAYVCNDCGSEHAKWQGQCSDCGEWNALTEIILQPAGQSSGVALKNVGGYAGELESQVQALSEVSLEDLPRIASGIGEFDRVLGGGFVQGRTRQIESVNLELRGHEPLVHQCHGDRVGFFTRAARNA